MRSVLSAHQEHKATAATLSRRPGFAERSATEDDPLPSRARWLPTERRHPFRMILRG
jgi:hypothetical protein